MKVEIVERTEEFIVLETSFDGLPAKRTSVHIDAIIDGITTLEEQIEIARADGEVRLRRLNAMNSLLNGQGQ